MSDKPLIYVYENDKKDEIKFELFPNGHLQMTIDFVKDMTHEEFLKFTKVCGYTLKRAPLRIIKKGEDN